MRDNRYLKCDVCDELIDEGNYSILTGEKLCSTHRDAKKAAAKKEKADKERDAKKEKADKKRDEEKMAQSSSNTSSSAGGFDSDTVSNVLEIGNALAGLLQGSTKVINEAKIEEISAMELSSDPTIFKKSFMFLVSQEFHWGDLDNSCKHTELAEAILSKLEAHLKYWKLEFTSEEDYERVKKMFEEEIATIKEKKKKEIMRFWGVTFGIFFGFVLFLAFFYWLNQGS